MVFSANASLKAWEAVVRGAARAKMNARDGIIEGAVAIQLVFYLPRPKVHYVSGNPARPLKANAPTIHTKKPDLDKLERAILDGLTDICFADDSVVCGISSVKLYGEKPGVAIQVRGMSECDLTTRLEQQPTDGLPGLLGTKT